MEFICYACEGEGVFDYGLKCPNCNGTGYDSETERIWKEVVDQRRKQGNSLESEDDYI